MLRKYVIFAAALVLMIVVAALSLTLPGVLVKAESERVMGKVYDPGQVYYADNVSAEDSIDFNTVMRVMMKENKWESEKTAIDLSQAEGTLLSEVEAKDFCANVLHFFTWDMWQQVYQYLAIDYTDYSLTDDQKLYLQTITGERADEGYVVNGETPYLVQNLLFNGEFQLYRYVETVFNTYYFYVWEYQVTDMIHGIDVKIEIDAVTLDVYSISIGGALFDGLPWKEIMSYFVLFQTELLYGDPSFISELDMEINEYNRPLFLPMVCIGNYLGYFNFGLDFYTATAYDMENCIYSAELQTDETGYAFYENSFLLGRQLMLKSGYGSVALCFVDYKENELFFGMDMTENTFRWHISTDINGFGQ